MEGFIVFMLYVAVLAFVVWVIYTSSKRKDKSATSDTYLDERPYRGGYRGELGSSGMSPKDVGPHSVNCECSVCLYGHDPDNGRCRCRWCEGFRRGTPLGQRRR